MPVDPRMFAPGDLFGAYTRGLQVREHQQEAENKKRLSTLLPQAVHGDQAAIDQIAEIDPNLFMKLDDRQREQAKGEIADLSAAVRWADTPDKWQYVQQHYGQKGVDLSPYDFSHREEGMVALGRLGEYLESAPKLDIRATEPGGGLYGVDPRTGQTNILVQPNDGSAQMGAPVSAPPPPPGFVVDGGPTPPASGGFPGY